MAIKGGAGVTTASTLEALSPVAVMPLLVVVTAVVVLV